MAITQIWVSPGTGGSLDVNTGGTVTETWIDQLLSNLLTMGGTAGFGTVSAANGIQPASGFFLGAVAGNWHAEGGTTASISTGSTVNVTFANEFTTRPFVVLGNETKSDPDSSDRNVQSITTTGCSIVNTSSQATVMDWIALGPT